MVDEYKFLYGFCVWRQLQNSDIIDRWWSIIKQSLQIAANAVADAGVSGNLADTVREDRGEEERYVLPANGDLIFKADLDLVDDVTLPFSYKREFDPKLMEVVKVRQAGKVTILGIMLDFVTTLGYLPKNTGCAQGCHRLI